MGDYLDLSYSVISMLSKIQQRHLNERFSGKEIRELCGNNLESEAAFKELLQTDLLSRVGRKYSKKKQVEDDFFILTARGEDFSAII